MKLTLWSASQFSSLMVALTFRSASSALNVRDNMQTITVKTNDLSWSTHLCNQSLATIKSRPMCCDFYRSVPRENLQLVQLVIKEREKSIGHKSENVTVMWASNQWNLTFTVSELETSQGLPLQTDLICSECDALAGFVFKLHGGSRAFLTSQWRNLAKL